MKKPRHLSLVKFDLGSLPVGCRDKYPFEPNVAYIFFGEIPNMPGHCIVAHSQTGRMFTGYHTENFVELTEEEV